MTVKRLSTLIVVSAVAALVLPGPASAQTACFLQGQYVFGSAINLPAPVHGTGTLQFTPGACIEGIPGTVVVKSDLVNVTTAYIVSGLAVIIPFPGGQTIGLMGLIEGGVARGFVYSGQADGGISFSGTALRDTQ